MHATPDTLWTGLDWAALGLYFLLVFGVAIWAALKGRATGSPNNFFLAGRNVGWFVIGASIFASNIGSEHLVGLAGSGAASGLPAAQFEILAAFALLLLGWLFVPFYMASGVFTMPEFLERRYSPAARSALAAISVVGYILTKISVTIAAGGIVFETLIGMAFWQGALVTVIATGAYTIFGGLRAVLYTDAVQMGVLLLGSVILTVAGLDAVGGWQGLTAALPAESFSLWRAADHPDYPWTGILLGAPILAVWYWCTDQYIVQRVLSASGISVARRATIVAGLLKQVPLFIFVLPGMIAATLAAQGAATLDDPDQAFPVLVQTLMPDGVRGLIAAGLLAALMSSLSSVFSACSSIITMDLFKRLVPTASERKLVTTGQLSSVLMVGLGLLWIPFMDAVEGGLFKYLQSVQAYIAPPITAVFLIGILWRGANATGAMLTLGVGFAVGLLRLVLEVNRDGLIPPLHGFTDINFLHFAALLFVFSSVLLVVSSKLTGPPARAKIAGLTLGDRATTPPQGLVLDKALTFLLVVCVAIVWTVFS